MPTVENKILNSKKIIEKTYGELIELAVSVGNFTRNEMRISFKISDKLDKKGKKFEFEGDELKFIKERVNAMGWIKDKEVLDFLDYVENISA